jgi:hypothetical protein
LGRLCEKLHRNILFSQGLCHVNGYKYSSREVLSRIRLSGKCCQVFRRTPVAAAIVMGVAVPCAVASEAARRLPAWAGTALGRHVGLPLPSLPQRFVRAQNATLLANSDHPTASIAKRKVRVALAADARGERPYRCRTRLTRRASACKVAFHISPSITAARHPAALRLMPGPSLPRHLEETRSHALLE